MFENIDHSRTKVKSPQTTGSSSASTAPWLTILPRGISRKIYSSIEEL